MAKTQLRPFYTDDELTKVYDHAYDHTKWQDHIDRINWTVDQTIKFVRLFMDRRINVADLTCGDGAVVKSLIEKSEFFVAFIKPLVNLIKLLIKMLFERSKHFV